MRYVFTDFFDNSSPFVTKHNWECHAVSIQHFDRKIGMADAARHNSDKDLISTWVVDGDVSNNGRGAGLFEKASFSED
jgi:hypothetical protein